MSAHDFEVLQSRRCGEYRRERGYDGFADFGQCQGSQRWGDDCGWTVYRKIGQHGSPKCEPLVVQQIPSLETQDAKIVQLPGRSKNAVPADDIGLLS